MPRFVGFYNGTEKQPERQVYKLSNSFCRKDTDLELELKVTVININLGCNEELLEKCESLRGYMIFVKKVRAKRIAKLSLEEAVRQTMEDCISQGVLTEFFREHKEEVVEMGIYEFDQELHDRVLLEDGEAIGIKKGIEIGKSQGIEIGKNQGIEIGFIKSSDFTPPPFFHRPSKHLQILFRRHLKIPLIPLRKADIQASQHRRLRGPVHR